MANAKTGVDDIRPGIDGTFDRYIDIVDDSRTHQHAAIFHRRHRANVNDSASRRNAFEDLVAASGDDTCQMSAMADLIGGGSIVTTCIANKVGSIQPVKIDKVCL